QLVANNGPNATAHSGFSYQASGANFYFNTPLDVTDPTKRSISFAQDPIVAPPADAAVNTLLLSDVVSFDIQMVQAPTLPAQPPPLPAQPPQGPPSFGYPVGTVLDFTDPPGGSYDTASPPGGILAVQITLRVWDLRTMQTRQITILQDM